ncbi:MAG: T9SS type A sorting domain-containing protein [Candidatus Kapaibacterium sp.]|nr:T9SS type A sorting domain-containing protein [Bacteroidota bacterium]
MKSLTILLAFITVLSCACAQKLQWQKTVGGGYYGGNFIVKSDTLFLYQTGIKIYYSINDGNDWIEYPDDTLHLYETMVTLGTYKYRWHFVYPNNYYVTYRYLERSSDGGVTWSVFNFLWFNAQYIYLRDNILHSYLMYKDTVYNYISRDSGQTWMYSSKLHHAVFGSNIFQYDTTTLFVSKNNKVSISTDDGLTILPAMLGVDTLGVFGDIKQSKSTFMAKNNKGVVVSSDGGRNWKLEVSGVENYVNKLIVGNSVSVFTTVGKILKENGNTRIFNSNCYITIDNGTTWRKIDTNFSSFIVELAVVNKKNLVALTVNGIFTSDDMGYSWKRSNYPSIFASTELLFTTVEGVFSSNKVNSLKHFTYSSNSWESFTKLSGVIYHYNYKDTLLFGVENESNATSVNVAYSVDKGNTIHTVESVRGGQCWNIFEHKGKVIALINQRIRRSKPESCLNFELVDSLNRLGYTSILFANNETLFSIGTTFAISNDTGKTWSVNPYKYKDSTIIVASVTGKTIYGVTESGQYYISLDNGSNWRMIPLIMQSTMRFFTRITAYENFVVAVNYNGYTSISTMMLSTNYGESWVDVGTSDSITDIGSIAFYKGSIFASTNKGILRADLPIVSSVVPVKQEEHDWSITPNPVSDSYQLRITPINSHRMVKMVDYLGRVIKTIQLPSNEEELVVSCTEVPNGVYTITLQSGVTTQSRTIVISR